MTLLRKANIIMHVFALLGNSVRCCNIAYPGSMYEERFAFVGIAHKNKEGNKKEELKIYEKQKELTSVKINN